ncbi:hypothetical protein Cyagr_0247 [Cyanobium gracile PCC 6307]|uniref:Uncharacterized protein n=2 Tax=Cyanobium gracile TaxID=59930 RepID=K9P4H3_CYAGP|nr:hypothetical protein Cyagr_0247 [Cyanobium gracile PCC 6307]
MWAVVCDISMTRVVQAAALLSLGLAPGVDPIGTCRELGVMMEPSAPGAGAADGEAEEGEQEGND